MSVIKDVFLKKRKQELAVKRLGLANGQWDCVLGKLKIWENGEWGNNQQITRCFRAELIIAYEGGKEVPAALCRYCVILGDWLTGFTQFRINSSIG
jgi:hypothetical protein